MSWRRNLALAVVLLAGPTATPFTAAAQSGSQLFVVTRHAEKASETERDPALSAAGRARALALDSAMAGMPVRAVIVSPFVRTRETASAVARRHGLVPIEIPIGRDGVAAHARAVAEEAHRHQGAVLVVGHSNTVGAIVRALGGDNSIGDLPDSDYQSLFVVFPDRGRVGTLRVRYGAN